MQTVFFVISHFQECAKNVIGHGFSLIEQMWKY
jgi:hypothetical protein